MEPNVPIKLRIGCPFCHARFLVAEHMLGHGTKCPKCGSHFRIPARRPGMTPAKPAAESSPDKPADQATAETSEAPSDNVTPAAQG